MAWVGADLALAGGSVYYVVAGVLMSSSAVELWRASPRGFYLFAAVLLLTMAWAVYEAGIDFWLVGSRIWMMGLLSLWLCTSFIRRSLWGEDTPALFRMHTVQISALASVAVLGAMTYDLLSDPVAVVSDTSLGLPQNPSDWVAYGGNKAGTRYAPHAQINTANVDQLTRVWEAETNQVGQFVATPIQIEDGIYLCTAQNIVLALDADSGMERWRFDPGNNAPPYDLMGNCRGVTHYQLADLGEDKHCSERIYTATTDARMIALDKNSGEPCKDFGTDGQISLLAGMGEVKPFYYFVTSPPTVASGALVVGGLVLDNQETEEPSGVVRAYDPVSGALLWAWDIGREGDTTMPSEGSHYTRGTPNVWSLTSADDELGLVYVPTGNATPDYFGGHRTEVMDKYSSSIVAIDARTGLTRWHFQTTHHDVWDYDVSSQPTLVDLTLDGAQRKAVIVPTKRGEIFVLDRETGELLTEVTERPVPQSDLQNERTAATQPFSTGMPSFAYAHLHESDMFGITPFDQMACRKAFLGLRYEGPMTPPSVEGTLVYPGPAGGMNWGSVAIDEERQLLVVNSLNLPWTVHMIESEDDLDASEEWFAPGYGVGGPQRGTPYAANVQMFTSPLSLPCLKPPYGEIAVIDLTTQETVWRRGMGFWELGFTYTAGSIITSGGLIFHAGITGDSLRAIDVLGGEVIWQDPLRNASQATPMSYMSPTTGRQYVLVTVPGDVLPPDDLFAQPPEGVERMGGKVIAYALRQPGDSDRE